MKLAEVEYNGRVRVQTHTAASGETYRFSGRKILSIESVRDARQFETKPNFDVTWTAKGRLAKIVVDESGDINDALSDMAYSAKKKLAGRFSDVDGRGTSEEIESALAKKAERIESQLTQQR